MVLPRSRLECSIWLWLLRLLPAILSSFCLFLFVCFVPVFPVHSASFSTGLLRTWTDVCREYTESDLRLDLVTWISPWYNRPGWLSVKCQVTYNTVFKKSVCLHIFSVYCVLTKCVSPWCNRTGWQGVKHQFICLLTRPVFNLFLLFGTVHLFSVSVCIVLKFEWFLFVFVF